jgi:hypothetical protein
VAKLGRTRKTACLSQADEIFYPFGFHGWQCKCGKPKAAQDSNASKMPANDTRAFPDIEGDPAFTLLRLTSMATLNTVEADPSTSSGRTDWRLS